VTAPTKADLRYSIKQIEKARRCIRAAQDCLTGAPVGQDLAARLEPAYGVLLSWSHEVIALRDETPNTPSE